MSHGIGLKREVCSVMQAKAVGGEQLKLPVSDLAAYTSIEKDRITAAELNHLSSPGSAIMFNASAFFAGLLLASIPLSLYILASIPFSFYILAPGVYWRDSGSERLGELYSDEDGVSIRETYDAFIRRSRRQILSLLVVGCAGFTVNGAAAVLRSGLTTEVEELPRLVEVFVWIVASVRSSSRRDKARD
ncbi:MAG: hypothetical protein Q9174_001686 [Haloplaca sp. 1 TL-2023]